ncbi:hypothetical protein K501DRAFT_266978 [Backusella circina FSU 941]|nr:hypothetical protein K501DRAFT_266978 [Backusella circina FSU 941]
MAYLPNPWVKVLMSLVILSLIEKRFKRVPRVIGCAKYMAEDSIVEKLTVYDDAEVKIVGSKVDVCFIDDYYDQEFDLCTVEVCLPDANKEKIYTGLGNLARTGRANIIPRGCCKITG